MAAGTISAEGARALAAAEHQQPDGAIGLRHRIGRAPQCRHFGAQRIAGQHDLGFVFWREAGDGKGGRHQPDLVHHQPVGAADHGILLDDGGGQARHRAASITGTDG